MSNSVQHSSIEAVAKLLIINDRGEALVLTLGKHHKHPEKSFRPDLPGGIIEPGESEQIAAIRETKEECGIELASKDVYLAYAQTAYYPAQNKSVVRLLYIAHITSTPQITLSWEHSDYQWVPIGRLGAVEFSPFFREAIGYCIAHNFI